MTPSRIELLELAQAIEDLEQMEALPPIENTESMSVSLNWNWANSYAGHEKMVAAVKSHVRGQLSGLCQLAILAQRQKVNRLQSALKERLLVRA